MSHKANTWAWEQDLPALQKIVLLALADRHNADTGRCDPSIKHVSPERTERYSAADCEGVDNSDAEKIRRKESLQPLYAEPKCRLTGAGRAGGGVQDVHQGVQDVHPNL